MYSRFWLASAQRSSETIVLFKNAESSRSFALDDFSFLWYDPFAGLMVFAIILYHKKKSLALPFRSVPGSFSLLGLQQPLFVYYCCHADMPRCEAFLRALAIVCGHFTQTGERYDPIVYYFLFASGAMNMESPKEKNLYFSSTAIL